MNMQPRRNILKGLAVGVPVIWTKPIVDFVLLPAHAQSSGFSCGPFQFCGQDDAVFLISDGLSCHFSPFDCCDESDIPNTDGNRIIMVDRDSGNWDANDAGDQEEFPVGDSNWSVSPELGDDNAPGQFNLTATRIGGALNGKTFNVILDVLFDDDDCTTVTVTMSPS